jgi:NAD(P)H dehydrogenase (quinone)
MPCKEDLAELAAAISAAADKQVTYTDLPAQELADADLGLGRGELSTGSGDLGRLIGRPTTSLAHAVADALR